MASGHQSEDVHCDDLADVAMPDVDEPDPAVNTGPPVDFTIRDHGDDDLLASHQRGMIFDGNDHDGGHYLEVRQRHIIEHLSNLEQSANGYPGYGQLMDQNPHEVYYCPPNGPSLSSGATLHPQAPPPQAPLLRRYHSSTGSVGGDQSVTDYTSSWGDPPWPNNVNNNHQGDDGNCNYMPGGGLHPGSSPAPHGSPRFLDPSDCHFSSAGSPSGGESYVHHPPQSMLQRSDPTSAPVSSIDISELGGRFAPLPDFFQQQTMLCDPWFLSPPHGEGDESDQRCFVPLSPSRPTEAGAAGVVDPAIAHPSQNPIRHRPPSAEAAELSAARQPPPPPPPQTSHPTPSSFLDTPPHPAHTPSSPAYSTPDVPPSITLSPAPETGAGRSATPRSRPRRSDRHGEGSSRSSRSTRHNRQGHAGDGPDFECVFAPFGCDCVFRGKNEWKRHATTIHLQLFMYECDLGDCANPGTARPIRYSPAATDHAATERVSHAAAAAAVAHRKYNRRDLFAQHVRRMHSPWGQDYTPTSDEATRFETEVTTPALNRCCVRLHHPPSHTCCPYCGDELVGWDERMEHVARHINKGDHVVYEDTPLMDWAVVEGIIRDDGARWVLAGPAAKKRRKS